MDFYLTEEQKQYRSEIIKFSREQLNDKSPGNCFSWEKWNKISCFGLFGLTAILKLFVSESYIKTCQDAMQIFGAYGYTKEFPIERELRDAMACSIYSGTSEMQRNTIFQLL